MAKSLITAFLLLGPLTSIAQPQFDASTNNIPDKPNSDSLYSETFGDWVINCTPNNKPKGQVNTQEDQANVYECKMSQRIVFDDSNETLLTVDLYLTPENGAPEAVFILPLGIPLNSPPTLSFDQHKTVSLTISHCYIDGCYFKKTLSNTLLEMFLSMQSCQLDLSGSDNESIRIPISGKGSRAAYNSFASIDKP